MDRVSDFDTRKVKHLAGGRERFLLLRRQRRLDGDDIAQKKLGSRDVLRNAVMEFRGYTTALVGDCEVPDALAATLEKKPEERDKKRNGRDYRGRA